MCGIAGVSFGPNCSWTEEQRSDFLNALAILNDRRGGDSWGYFTLEANKQPFIKRGLKQLGSSDVSKMFDKPMLFMHSRAATTGGVTIDNSHPFEIGDIVGAHNGIISNAMDMNLKYKRNFSVDSQHIFAHLNDGLDIAELEGWGVIEWWDKRQPTKLFLSKIGGGEISVKGIGTHQNKEGVIWSSDSKHLAAALKHINATQVFDYKTEVGEVFSVDFNDRTKLKNVGMKMELGTYIRYRICPHNRRNRQCDGDLHIVICNDCDSLISYGDCTCK